MLLNISGITVKTSSSTILYVELQNSKFLIPPLENLGNGYTLLTFWDDGDLKSFESRFVISAPLDSTTVYLDSSNVKEFSSLFHETWFHQGNLFQFDLNAGDAVFVSCEFDVTGIRINSSNPLFVAMGTQHKDEDFVTVQLPNEKWGRRFLIDDPGSIVFWGKNVHKNFVILSERLKKKVFSVIQAYKCVKNLFKKHYLSFSGSSNSSLIVQDSVNDAKIYNFEHFPANLSFQDNHTFPCVLSFSTPVMVSQRFLLHHSSEITSRTRSISPTSLYFHLNVFSDSNIFCFPKHTRYTSMVPLGKKAEELNKTINIEEEQFSSALFVFKTKNNQMLVKELLKETESQSRFSGYLFCSPSNHLYPHPSAWHALSCETDADAGCDQNILIENGPILIKVLPDPYITSPVTSVTLSLVSGIVAAIVFITLAYLADLIRTRIAGSGRIGTLIE